MLYAPEHQRGKASNSHYLYIFGYFVLVGSSMKTIPHVEHVIQIPYLLLKGLPMVSDR